MTNIHGNDVILYLLVDAVYYPILCATDMNFSVKQDVVLATSANTGIARKKKLRGLYEWTVTTSGLTKVNNNDGQISFFYILQESVRGTEQEIKIEFDDEDGNEQVITGTVIIPDLSISAPTSDFSSADITFEGSGEFEMNPIEPPVPTECEQATIYIDCVAGEFSVHSDLLEAAGVVIISVARTGQVHYETTGTPVSLEFKTDLPNGDIYFDSTNVFNPDEWVSVEYKIE
jgi:hypothetical protein